MSLCLIIETKDNIWVGSDSAVSYSVDNKLYRIPGQVIEKTFHHANALFFMCGSVYNALMIRQYIESLPVITHNCMAKIADEMRRITTSEDSRRCTQEGVQTALVVTLCDTGRVYGINEGNNFAVESPIEPNMTEFRYICCLGFDDEASVRGGEMASQCAGIENIPEVYQQIFSILSRNGIGGHVDLFKVNAKDQTVTKYHIPIVEKNIEYLDVHATMGVGSSINWSFVNPPSAQQVGARPDWWLPTAGQVGAIPNVANAIQSTHISANAVQSPHIMANAISANHIQVNAITTQHIQAGAITADKIAAGAVTTHRLVSPNNPNNFLTLNDGGNFADLTWFRNGRNFFQVWDGIDHVSLRGMGRSFLVCGALGVNAEGGVWNFSNVPTIGGNPIPTAAQMNALAARVTALENRQVRAGTGAAAHTHAWN